jgi:hypothetical protein
MSSAAVVVRYHTPGNVRGPRLSAQCAGVRVSVPYPHESTESQKRRVALAALCAKLDAPAVEKGRAPWWGARVWHEGVLPNGDTVFVMETTDSKGETACGA